MEILSSTIFRLQLVETAAKLLAAFILLVLLTSPLLVPQSSLIIGIGVFDLVITVTYLSVMPLVILTHGVQSYFIYFLAIFPMMAGLLINARAAHLIAGLLVLNIILLTVFDSSLPNLEQFNNDRGQTVLRAYWLCLTTIITSIFVHYYDRFNSHFNTQLRDLAFHDTLTRIPNRRSIEQALKIAQDYSWRHKSWLAVLMIDIDDFKELNDAHGHVAGDQCLVEVARCLKKNVRRNEDMVARYGGEEFVAVLPGVGPKQIVQISEQLRSKIESLQIRTDTGKIISLTVTIGSCCRNGDARVTARDILIMADRALYQGKSQGRNQVVIENGIGEDD